MRLIVVTQIVDSDDPILGFFHRWLEEFAKQFKQVDVICLKEGKHNLPNNVAVYSLGKEAGVGKLRQLARYYWHFWRLYVFREVDYVFFHMGDIFNVLAVPFALVRRFKGCRFYWWKTQGKVTWVGRLALCFVDRVYTAVEESFPVVSKKRQVVGHAIDVEQFAKKQSSDMLAKPVVLFVGRLMEVKRVEQVIALAKTLKQRKVAVETRIVGAPVDPVYMAKLEALVNHAELNDTLTFVGPLTHQEVVDEYCRATVLVNPSDNDGLDKVVLEAMAVGTVPLTGNLSFQTMLQPFNLFLVKGDIDGYADRVERTINLSVAERETLQSQLREVVTKQHALSTLVDRIF